MESDNPCLSPMIVSLTTGLSHIVWLMSVWWWATAGTWLWFSYQYETLPAVVVGLLTSLSVGLLLLGVLLLTPGHGPQVGGLKRPMLSMVRVRYSCDVDSCAPFDQDASGLMHIQPAAGIIHRPGPLCYGGAVQLILNWLETFRIAPSVDHTSLFTLVWLKTGEMLFSKTRLVEARPCDVQSTSRAVRLP